MKLLFVSIYALASYLGFVEPNMPSWDDLPQEMGEFFQASIDWGLEAGMRFLAYFGGIALIVKIFQSK